MKERINQLRQIVGFDPLDAATLTTDANVRQRIRLKKIQAAKVCQTDGNEIVFPA